MITLKKIKIAALRHKMSLLDIIGADTLLAAVGSKGDYKGHCSFCQQLDFYVHPGKGIWKCFACHDGGDLFCYIMRKQKLGFQESICWLIKWMQENVSRDMAD